MHRHACSSGDEQSIAPTILETGTPGIHDARQKNRDIGLLALLVGRPAAAGWFLFAGLHRIVSTRAVLAYPAVGDIAQQRFTVALVRIAVLSRGAGPKNEDQVDSAPSGTGSNT